MKIVGVSAKNFGSYQNITFNLKNTGLTLISGDTGVGKSTLLDTIAWTLYGVTSKDGAADEIKAWDADGPTEGRVTIEAQGVVLEVYRVRGPRNDLYWRLQGSDTPVRGKDLSDTQKLLESRLGVSKELFLLGSYLTQFSTADTFFIAKAKDRREVLEAIADQEYAIKLGERASEARKSAKKEKEQTEKDLAKASGATEASEANIKTLETNKDQWQRGHKIKIETAQVKFESFRKDQTELIDSIRENKIKWDKQSKNSQVKCQQDIDAIRLTDDASSRNRIADLKATIDVLKDEICLECGAPKCNGGIEGHRLEIYQLEQELIENKRRKEQITAYKASLKELKERPNPYLRSLEQSEASENPYDELLKSLKKEANPFINALTEETHRYFTNKSKAKDLDVALTNINTRCDQLSWLYDKSFELRAICMQNAVDCVQRDTNACLERYFDARIRVEFILQDLDKLDIRITNDGHECSFRALSGGERTMLKLSFVLSLMKAAQNKAGIQFHQLFLDEPFHGLSAELKVKAFGLLQQLELEYSSVLVIDHSVELKAEFINIFEVTKSGGHSEIHGP